MNDTRNLGVSIREIRPDLIHHQSYTSREVAELEAKKLWPSVWQGACRLEEIPYVGDYVVYEIVDQSIIVVRSSESGVKAFHNVCPHRGRRLLSGSGHISKFHCAYHAWQWDLKGAVTRILDHHEWKDCPSMSLDDMAMIPVHTAHWGGFVYINMSEKPEPFEEFIAPARKALDVLNFDDMRYSWYNIVKLKANWKTAQEAFAESYHVMGTHPQFAALIDEKNHSIIRGRHSTHTYEFEYAPGTPSRRLNLPKQNIDQWREGFARYLEAFPDQLAQNGAGNGMMTGRSAKVGAEAVRALPAGTDVGETMTVATMAMKAAADRAGAFFALPTMEQWQEIGGAWVMFPNQSFPIAQDGTLVMSARPDPEDPFNPDRCELHMISLVHFGKDEPVPPLEKVLIRNWREESGKRIPKLLAQDMSNIEAVQLGMHSIALNGRGLRPNPVQELTVPHLHRQINEFIYG